jgi:nucleotide-binding universal stress UspA family protein
VTTPLVLCAVDLGPTTGHVLFHAAGFAAALGAELKIIHVCGDESHDTRERVRHHCLEAGPYQSIEETDVIVRTGRVSEMIQREALRLDATLIVMGSRAHTGLARLLLGSTSAAVLRGTQTPVLLVPPNDIDIVSVGDQVVLTCGRIVAAVDLNQDCERQLHMASQMARLAGKPLSLLTVARARTTEVDAMEALRQRAHGLSPVRPRSLIVRRGDVATEISECAVAEGAGLVVMGLKTRPRWRAGTIASAVLETGRAFVLAVPGC